ncbi:MAG: DUF397 domain-containing protein [Stackebrandtia sp.]
MPRRWVKSSRTQGNGQCVEAAVTWVKSTRTTSNGQCVEVAAVSDNVFTRDSKDPSGPVLRMSRAEWSGLLSTLREAE